MDREGEFNPISLPGTFRASNLTPDKETGIGNMTDGEIARALRYSVGSDGRLLIPVMPFQELSDEDLTAIISFLRSQESVKNDVEHVKAIYRYLQTVDPVNKSIDKIVYAPGEEL